MQSVASLALELGVQLALKPFIFILAILVTRPGWAQPGVALVLDRPACSQVWKENQAPPSELFSMTFEFESELQLDPTNLRVRWQGVEFTLSHFEYLALEQILTSETLVSTDEQLMDAVWFEGQTGEGAVKTAARNLFFQIQKKFLAIDPSFERLKRAKGRGYYWSTREVVTVQLGSLRIAKEVPLMWWNEIPFHNLTPSTHHILLQLMENQGQPMQMRVLSENTDSLKVIVSGLNKALEPLIGGYLIISARAEVESGFVQLNQKLLFGHDRGDQASFNTIFEFDSDLQLDSIGYRALWKGTAIQLSPREFRILQQILKSENVISTEEMIEDVIWGGGNKPLNSPLIVRNLISSIRQKFLAADRDFNNLRFASKVGYYWATRDLEKWQWGALMVAKNIPVIWWNGFRYEGLSQSSYQILLRLVQNEGRPTPNRKLSDFPGSFAASVRSLNKLFDALAGGPIVIPMENEYEEGFVHLNPKLFKAQAPTGH